MKVTSKCPKCGEIVTIDIPYIESKTLSGKKYIKGAIACPIANKLNCFKGCPIADKYPSTK